MAIPTTNAAALTLRIQTEIRDGGQTFSTAELAEALHRAIEDEAVFSIIEITVPITGARQYALDPTYTTIYNIGIDVDGDGWPEMDMGNGAWDLVFGNLIIKPRWMNIMGTMYIQVGKKWLFSDNIPSYLSAYIIESSICILTELLQNTYESRFLNNDVTMAELLNRGVAAQQNVKTIKKGLRNVKPIRM